MNTFQILSADYIKNHNGREYSLSEYVAAFEKYLMNGGVCVAFGNVIIRFNDSGEFHCCNSGNGKDLTGAVDSFCDAAKTAGAKSVFTFYDNARVSEMAKYSRYPAIVEKVDAGIDKTYRMTFNLV